MTPRRGEGLAILDGYACQDPTCPVCVLLTSPDAMRGHSGHVVVPTAIGVLFCLTCLTFIPPRKD